MLPLETDSGSFRHAKLDYHATVRELPSNERPRERLQHFGPQALSMTELLAIILRTGTRGDNALELANRLLTKYGGLPGLMRADFRELCAEQGMGEAKSAQVKATLEIGRRLGLLQADTRYKVRTLADAANLVMLDLTSSGHSWQRGCLARQMSAPKSSAGYDPVCRVGRQNGFLQPVPFIPALPLRPKLSRAC